MAIAVTRDFVRVDRRYKLGFLEIGLVFRVHATYF